MDKLPLTLTDTIRENLRALLELHGMSQTEASLGTGHERSWFNKVISGARGIPLDELDAIAQFFGVDPCQLIQPGGARERRVGAPDRRANAGRPQPKAKADDRAPRTFVSFSSPTQESE